MGRKESNPTKHRFYCRLSIFLLQVPDIVLCLWDILLDLDDLTASTNSIMSLLSTLMATPTASVLDWYVAAIYLYLFMPLARPPEISA